MKQEIRKSLFLLFPIILFLGACSNSTDVPRYRLASCGCQDLPAIAGQECYRLSIKENRNDPQSRFIDIFVVVLRAFNADPSGKPTIFLHGGPGNIGTQLIGKFNTEEFRRTHDLIFFDQRGLGHSSPSLHCPGLNSLVKADTAVIGQCLDEFTAAGADIRGYDTRQSALDLRELRLSFGIGQWNVYGVSYGTRYALDLLRVDPDGTACLVLDSPMSTSDPNNTTDINLNTKRVIELMFADCQAQESCAAAYPGLEQKFSAVTKALQGSPIILQVKNPATGLMMPLSRSADDFTGRIGAIIGSLDYARLGPSSIERMYRHVTGQTVMTSRELDQFFANRDPSTFGNSVHWGLALSIYCRELYPALDFEALDIARAALSPFGMHNQDEDVWRAAAPIAHAGRIEPAFYNPVTSNKPVLILSGTYDTSTPRAWADKVASTLSQATVVTVPAAGHAVFDLACPRSVMSAFLDNPPADPDTSCVSSLPQRPQFTLQ